MGRAAGRRILLALAALALAAQPATASTNADPRLGGFMSPNVTWIANIPLDSPGVGARVVRVGAQTRLYVTGVKGLSIYDVTNPTLPLLLGTMPFPHWENEDVEVSADGKWVIVAFDVGGPSMLVDASIPQAPRIAARIPGSEHTISCADARCLFAYGSSGRTYDLRDRAAPKVLARGWADVLYAPRAHNLNRDDAGLVISDTSPRFMFDPRRDPTRPRLLTLGLVPQSRRLAYQHNNIRPNARLWRPRRIDDTSRSLRPGELVLSNGETNLRTKCNSGSGPFATWSVRNFDRHVPMQVLDVFRPVNGDYMDGDPAVNALGCSGHWFTWRRDVVAAGWYEHGTRFLGVNPRTGKITEVGYFQPVVASTSAAYWITDEIVYTVDYARGIDILRFDRSAPCATRADTVASWLAKLGAPPQPAAEAERFLCRLAA